MLNQSQSSKYIVDFFYTEENGAMPADSMCLMAESEAEAIAQANWLAVRVSYRDFHVRAVAKGMHSIIYRSSALARAA